MAGDWRFALPREIIGADVQSAEEEGQGRRSLGRLMILRMRAPDGGELPVKGTGISVGPHVRADWGKRGRRGPTGWHLRPWGESPSSHTVHGTGVQLSLRQEA